MADAQPLILPLTGPTVRPPPLRGLFARLGASLYGAVVAHRNRRFDAGRGVVRLDRPVISVGNLSVGGTGKTPMVQRLLRVLRDADRNPCVAMRGYRTDGAHGEDSDEAIIYRRAFPGLPIVAQPNRIDGLIELFATPDGEGVDCIVLDDGFQHRRIARDLDIVLIDATRDPFRDALLPAGWLREPAENLRRASAVVITHAEAVTRTDAIEIETRIWDAAPGCLTAVSRHDWAAIIRTSRTGDEELPVSAIREQRIYAACAIGNPGAFLLQAERQVGRSLVGSLVLRDHHAFDARAIRRLLDDLKRTDADALLVTEKDWTKLFMVSVDTWPCPIVRPRLEITFDRGGPELVEAVLKTVRDFKPEE